MNFLKNWKTVLAVLLGLTAFVSCKDDDETETLPSLSGTLALNYNDFTFIDSATEESRTVTFVPSGLTHPEGGTISYSYTVSPDMSSSETSEEEDGSYTYTFKEDIGTYTVTCSGSASGYYGTSVSYTVLVVSETESLTDTGLDEITNTFTDERDGKEYKYRTWGGYDWFCQNLSYAGTASAVKGLPYRDSEVMGKILGRFYTFSELDDVCPTGWDVPSEDAWLDLAKAIWPADAETPTDDQGYFEGIAGSLMADANFNSEKMWEFWPEVDITNKSGLSAIPAGFANVDGSLHEFFGINTYTTFWTSTPDATNSDRAYYKYMICGNPDVISGSGDTSSFAANVRCVRAVTP